MHRKRDITTPINPNLSLDPLLRGPPLVSPSTFDLVRLMALQEVEDARQYNPDPQRMPRKYDGNRSIIRETAGSMLSTYHSVHNVMGFVNNPLNPVVHCVRRKMRREVLFAFKRTRKGSGGRKHRNWKSNYRC